MPLSLPGGGPGQGQEPNTGRYRAWKALPGRQRVWLRRARPRLRVYGPVWLATKMPTDAHNHARVEGRTDGEATRQFDLPSSLAYAGPADGSASGASTADALIV